MNRFAVHEKVQFNDTKNDQFFYINVAYRNVKPWSQAGVFHFHNSIELIYCISNKLKVTFDSTEIILDKGDFLFINSGVTHSTDALFNENEHYYVKFEPIIVNTLTSHPLPPAEYFFSLLPDYIIFRKSKDSDYIHYLFKRCKDNFSHNDFAKRLILQGSIMQLAAYIFENKLKDFVLEEFNEKNSIFLETSEYINKNYSTVTLEDAAKNMSMSYSYFSRIFKKEFNTSFSKYVTTIRIQKSLEFLTNTTMTVADIAAECGFSNLSHFTKCFKEAKGMTPNAFRTIVKK